MVETIISKAQAVSESLSPAQRAAVSATGYFQALTAVRESTRDALTAKGLVEPGGYFTELGRFVKDRFTLGEVR